MESISSGIIVLLTIYVCIAQLDAISVQIGFYSPLFAGALTGCLLGDTVTGLAIGASLQLMVLGVATYGGASVPDFLSGAIIGTAYAILSGKGAEYGIGLAVPIGLLLTQLDILGRMCNVYFQHRALRCAELGDDRGVERSNLMGIIPWTVSRAIPVFVGLYFGNTVVTTLNSYFPAWIMAGLRAAGGILPAMGIAILMRYLPLRRFYPFYIIGFVVMAYGAGSYTVLAVALLGLAFAGIYLMLKKDLGGAAMAGASGKGDETEVEIDE